MVASEACLVVDLVVSSKLINQVDSLLTCFAFLGSPSKCCHPHPISYSPNPQNLYNSTDLQTSIHQKRLIFSPFFFVNSIFFPLMEKTFSLSFSLYIYLWNSLFQIESEVYSSESVTETIPNCFALLCL